MRLQRYQEAITKPSVEDLWKLHVDQSLFKLQLMSSTLSVLSQHEGHALAFYDDGWLVSFINKHQERITFNISEKYEFQKEIFSQKIKQQIQDSTHISIKNILIFSVIDPQTNKKNLIILFSQQTSIPSLEHLELIQQYLDDQQHIANQTFEQAELKEKLNQLEQINQGRTKYLSVISHDLRAPFHGILGCVDILMTEADTLTAEDKTKLLEYVYDTSHSTYNLLENLLNWSMIDGGKFSLKRVHFRISDVVQMILDLLCASAYKKEIKIECILESDLYVYADINMVTSILQNLVSNALKFTLNHANKKIIIRTVSQHGRVKISVEDEGIGLTKSQLARLFKEQSISTTPGTKGEKGTGLGLVLCKKFVEMNDGEIKVESVLNQGTTFNLFFPIGTKDN